MNSVMTIVFTDVVLEQVEASYSRTASKLKLSFRGEARLWKPGAGFMYPVMTGTLHSSVRVSWGSSEIVIQDPVSSDSAFTTAVFGGQEYQGLGWTLVVEMFVPECSNTIRDAEAKWRQYERTCHGLTITTDRGS